MKRLKLADFTGSDGRLAASTELWERIGNFDDNTDIIILTRQFHQHAEAALQ